MQWAQKNALLPTHLFSSFIIFFLEPALWLYTHSRDQGCFWRLQQHCPSAADSSEQQSVSTARHVKSWTCLVLVQLCSVLFPCLTLGSEPRQCRLQCSLLTGHLSHDEMMSVLGGASREARQGIQMHSPMYPCPWSVSSCVRALELRLQVCFSDSLTASFCFRAFPPLLLTREPVRKISMVFLIGNAQMSRENLE